MPPQNTFPDVFIEELPGSPKPIEGVSTSSTVFVGPTLTGPTDTTPALLTSLRDFESIYGDSSDFTFSDSPTPIHNFLFSAARAFFENGGQRLYIARVAAAAGQAGLAPTATDYRTALITLEALGDISVVAAPGSTVFAGSSLAQVAAVHAELIAHVSRPAAYRFAVLDPPPGASTTDIQAIRSQVDSRYAALYYPWVTIADPNGGATPIAVPPSGFICGIYVNNDTNQGVFKAPANLPLVGALGFERSIADAESTALNDLGINTLRFFPGRGNLVWGARTTSSDPDWKYINVRRFFIYIESSIEKGIQWAVFGPNDSLLWAALASCISSFLVTEWRRGALQGTKPEEAFFVKCDRTTMTQSDIDSGRLVCLVGMAPVRPAEFVIVRICVKTAAG
ncbi:MAG TPA: phage tail sheath subtilisin-like domain-containing protein [Edaphobacter sp.]|nr:phage tail sheath subtilisin-like domain-containing protein [Edaphobacter sp.]